MYYVIEYDGLRKIMDVKHDMQTELQNQRFPSALADLMKTGDCIDDLALLRSYHEGVVQSSI